MAKNTKWDTEELKMLLGNLELQKEIIENNRDFLKNINSEIEQAWQGYAGRSFDERMDIDAENVDIVLKGVEALIDDLNNVITNCYESCETDISAKVKNLKSKI